MSASTPTQPAQAVPDAPPKPPVIELTQLPVDLPAKDPGFDNLTHYVEEIKSMREEINWRVKIAYNASIIFISAISVIGGTLFSADNKFLEKIETDPKIMTISGIGILIAVASWVGAQNANHLIEKRIELYTLELMKLVHAQTGHVHYSWLGFLYGSKFFRKKTKNFFASFLNASIGMFIYFLPNAVAIGVLYYLATSAPIGDFKFLFAVSVVFFLVAMGSTFLFFFYVVKVNNKFTEFFKTNMQPYFDKKGMI